MANEIKKLMEFEIQLVDAENLVPHTVYNVYRR